MKPAPIYPGYKAPKCNGCGLCCLTSPCAVSDQAGLWQKGRCKALKYRAGRYWCELAVDSKMVKVALGKMQAKLRHYLGLGHGCDHRAAWTIEEALALLKVRNIHDEITGAKKDYYPRGAAYHDRLGRVWSFTLTAPDAPVLVRQIHAGDSIGPMYQFSEWEQLPDVRNR